MPKPTSPSRRAPAARAPRREASLSRERIVEASIVILDTHGEDGLTFRALSEHLATGPGAIYGHVENKGDLLTAAADGMLLRALPTPDAGTDPEAAIRAVALSLFDVVDDHPWVGSALSGAPGSLPVVRLVEALGQPLCALHVPASQQWAAVCALLSYILGVARQNAANAQLGRALGAQREDFLASLAATWAALDETRFPFARSIASSMSGHDDRADFLMGVDLILAGLRLHHG